MKRLLQTLAIPAIFFTIFFILNHTRPLERAVESYLFEGGLEALLFESNNQPNK